MSKFSDIILQYSDSRHIFDTRKLKNEILTKNSKELVTKDQFSVKKPPGPSGCINSQSVTFRSLYISISYVYNFYYF